MLTTLVFAHDMKKRAKRVATNLTLSEIAKNAGMELADLRGMSFSQVVEQLIRDEKRRIEREGSSGQSK